MRAMLRPSVCLALLVPGSAFAETTAAPYLTERSQELLGFQDTDFDTGWIPAGSPIQVRFYAHAGNTITVSMDGQGHYDWQEEQVSFLGTPGGGVFDVDLGVQVEAQVRFDITNISWTGDLINPFSWGVFESATFDPYLLEGNPNRPAVLSFEIPREQLASIDLGVDVAGASGALVVDIGGTVTGTVEGQSITTWSVADTSNYAQIVHELGLGDLPPDAPWTDFETLAQLRAHVGTGLTLLLYPAVVVNVLGNDYTLVEFEVPIDLPPVEEDWSFDPVPVNYDAPPEPTPGDDDDSSAGHIVHGGADERDGEYASVGGCGCETGPGGGTAPLGSILGLTVLGFRRRRSAAGSPSLPR
jgi:hypothetical protein